MKIGSNYRVFNNNMKRHKGNKARLLAAIHKKNCQKHD
ncbi:hypothetical protein GMES_3116 [Paraglaciecola mesophila KMM 241]|uniref:Uncharacterized protein n=1 Tax=Paraglaciecola mesophila KMM 241 TaxID=1128912 RepID=K6ZPZ8_9ALTE|nr:hypothetical protein GMES_3116 [Paraglaciecola mesophila KMM 241]